MKLKPSQISMEQNCSLTKSVLSVLRLEIRLDCLTELGQVSNLSTWEIKKSCGQKEIQKECHIYMGTYLVILGVNKSIICPIVHDYSHKPHIVIR